jgi:signal transduction histidine kinase
MEHYLFFIGEFDHKLGPVCICPKNSCNMLTEIWEKPSTVIQDGLNTSSAVLTIDNYEYFIQVRKFALSDERLRGGTLRCCLFCVVPKAKPLLPDATLEEIINGIIEIAGRNDMNPSSEEADEFVMSWENRLNERLDGEIGEGLVDHRMRELLTTIIGYSQLLLDGAFEELNDKQRESITYILAHANELLNLRKLT